VAAPSACTVAPAASATAASPAWRARRRYGWDLSEAYSTYNQVFPALRDAFGSSPSSASCVAADDARARPEAVPRLVFAWIHARTVAVARTVRPGRRDQLAGRALAQWRRSLVVFGLPIRTRVGPRFRRRWIGAHGPGLALGRRIRYPVLAGFRTLD